MKGKNRRDFLKCGAMLGAAVVSAGFASSDADASPKTAQPNRSGIKARTLGLGKTRSRSPTALAWVAWE